MAGSIGKHSASYGSASHAEVYRSEANEGCRGVARWAKPGSIGKHSASYGSASHAQFYRSEANEGCPAIARSATAGLGQPPAKSWAIRLAVRVAASPDKRVHPR